MVRNCTKQLRMKQLRTIFAQTQLDLTWLLINRKQQLCLKPPGFLLAEAQLLALTQT